MSADHSEARERARQEFEALLKTACRYCGSDYSGPEHLAYKSPEEGSLRWLAYAAFSLGRRSLEQERDELRTLVGLQDDLLRAYRTRDHKLADRTLTKMEKIRGVVHKGDS